MSPDEPHNHIFPPKADPLDIPACVICDYPYHRDENGALYITFPRA